MTKLATMAAGAVLLLSSTITASADIRRSDTAGPGFTRCADYTKPSEAMDISVTLWTEGFMSALNVANHPHMKNLHSIAAGSRDAVPSVIRSYCRHHPLNFIVQGVLELYDTLDDLEGK